jgi:hypothetical protein
MGKGNISEKFLLPKIPNDWFLFSLMWPFGAFIRVMRNFRGQYAQTIFWLFCVYFGFTFFYGDLTELEGADSIRYAKELKYFHDKSFSFSQLFGMLYNPSYGYTDVYQPLVTWFVALFTDNPRWLFTFFAAIYGFFYTKNLWFIFNKIDNKKRIGILLFIFIMGYALSLPIWYINGVRMWTAVQVYIFGLLSIYLNDNKKGYIWVVVSILFHWSLMLPVVILLVFKYVPKNLMGLIIFFFSGALISEVDLMAVQNNLSFLPEIFQTKVSAYTNEAYAESTNLASNALAWHVLLAGFFGKWVMFIWVFVLYYYRRDWVPNLHRFEQLFAFALFLGGIGLIASNIPSGFRYYSIAKMLFYAVFIMALTQKSFVAKTRLVGMFTIPALGFFVIFMIRTGFNYMGFQTLIGNPIIALFWETKVPLIDFVKGLL